MVNHQLRVLGPLLNRLTSTGVFFTSPRPVAQLPLLPGTVALEARSTGTPRGLSDAQPPLMVGEFRDAEGQDWAMVVNLSLERSCQVRLTMIGPYGKSAAVSAEDGRFVPWDAERGQWLLAGHGVLIPFE